MLHIYAPKATAKFVKSGTCPDCHKRTRFLTFFTPWHGDDSTCLRCGRMWMDGEWMPLDFARGVREKSIEAAKKRFRAMPPISKNHWEA